MATIGICGPLCIYREFINPETYLIAVYDSAQNKFYRRIVFIDEWTVIMPTFSLEDLEKIFEVCIAKTNGYTITSKNNDSDLVLIFECKELIKTYQWEISCTERNKYNNLQIDSIFTNGTNMDNYYDGTVMCESTMDNFKNKIKSLFAKFEKDQAIDQYIYQYMQKIVIKQALANKTKPIINKSKKIAVFETPPKNLDDSDDESDESEDNDNENPVKKKAYDNKITTVTHITWNLSKCGIIIPHVHFEKVQFGHYHVFKATGFNAKYIVDNKIGPGAIITVCLKGDLIPFIIKVVKPAEKPALPDNMTYKWSSNKVYIIKTTDDDDDSNDVDDVDDDDSDDSDDVDDDDDDSEEYDDDDKTKSEYQIFVENEIIKQKLKAPTFNKAKGVSKDTMSAAYNKLLYPIMTKWCKLRGKDILRTPYQIFIEAELEHQKKLHPKLPNNNLMKLAAKKWNLLNGYEGFFKN